MSPKIDKECGVDLSQFRPAVEHWKAQAEVGEIAHAMRMHYKLTAEDYRKRVTEADRLLAIIDQFSKQGGGK